MPMYGYVVSKGGTFGTVERCYTTEFGEPMIVIRWGPLGWITPVPEAECKQLQSRWKEEARVEAREWLQTLEKETYNA